MLDGEHVKLICDLGCMHGAMQIRHRGEFWCSNLSRFSYFASYFANCLLILPLFQPLYPPHHIAGPPCIHTSTTLTALLFIGPVTWHGARRTARTNGQSHRRDDHGGYRGSSPSPFPLPRHHQPFPPNNTRLTELYPSSDISITLAHHYR